MSVFGRATVATLVFAGSVGAAIYAANNHEFYDAVTGTVAETAEGVLMAGSLVSGDAHLAGEDEGFRKTSYDRIEGSSVVTHVEVIGGDGKQRIVLLDPEGREVYTHDPEHNMTIIAKDAIIPSITVRDDPDAIAELRVVTAAPAVEAPEELRQALAFDGPAPDMFYREDL